MDFAECFRLLTARLREEIVVTSAGNCSELWWEITRETERVFYLEASMSLASLFAAGIALGTSRNVVALSGDGAFCMNPGMLMVERAMALPNLKHFVLSNRCYGSTHELPLRFAERADYAAMARAAGIARVYCLATVEQLGQALDEILSVAGYVFAVLEVEPLGRELASPPLDGPELKFRFGRYLERIVGRPIFDAPLYRSNGRSASASI
jgi:sulfopyruvate decarboxylase subunit beta